MINESSFPGSDIYLTLANINFIFYNSQIDTAGTGAITRQRNKLLIITYNYRYHYHRFVQIILNSSTELFAGDYISQ